MRKKFILAFFSALLFVLQLPAQADGAAAPVATKNPARPIVDEMMRAMGGIHTLTGRIKGQERWSGKDKKSEMRFKLMVNPHKLYIYNINPNNGVEILYIKGWNDGDAFVNPNGFPWVNVDLDPYGSRLLEKQHHPILDVGFEYTRRVVKHVLAKYAEDFEKFVTYEGKETYDGKQVYVIKISYSDYHYENYTVKSGENLFKIDHKLCVPAYKLIEINKGVNGYFDVKAGQVIKVPNVYAKEVILKVDEKTFLPVVQILYDDVGEFERYEYHDLRVNPRFNTNTFDTENPEYGF